MRPASFLPVLLAAQLGLAGCGNKGPLFLPEPGQTPPAAQKPAAPDARRQ